MSTPPSSTTPVRPPTAERPHRPSPQLDAALMLQQSATHLASLNARLQQQQQQQQRHAAAGLAPPVPMRSQSYAPGSTTAGDYSQPGSPSPVMFAHAHLTSSPPSGGNGGSLAPPSTPLPMSMGQAGFAGARHPPPFRTQQQRPRASTSQALFRSSSGNVSSSGKLDGVGGGVGVGVGPGHRSVQCSPDSSPLFRADSISGAGNGSGARHGRSMSSSGGGHPNGALGASVSFSPLIRSAVHSGSSPLLFADNFYNDVSHASPMLLPQPFSSGSSASKSSGNGRSTSAGVTASGEDGDEEEEEDFPPLPEQQRERTTAVGGSSVSSSPAPSASLLSPNNPYARGPVPTFKMSPAGAAQSVSHTSPSLAGAARSGGSNTLTPRTLAYATEVPAGASSSSRGSTPQKYTSPQKALSATATPASSASASSSVHSSPATRFLCRTCGANFDKRGSLMVHEATHPASVQARLDEQTRASPPKQSGFAIRSAQEMEAQRAATLSAEHRFGAHPEPPFDVKDVSASPPPVASSSSSSSSPAKTRTPVRQEQSPEEETESSATAGAGATVFPPFSPSEVRPLGSPASSAHVFTYAPGASPPPPPVRDTFAQFSPSELQRKASSNNNASAADTAAAAAAGGASAPGSAERSRNNNRVNGSASSKGFSPGHEHWRDNAIWDERYDVEASASDDNVSVQGSPRQTRARPPQFRQPQQQQQRETEPVSPLPITYPPARIQMSPDTRSAFNKLVPSLSWLLILTRQLVLADAVTPAQGAVIKARVLQGDPRLLSAVERCVVGQDDSVIVDAIMACLPQDSDGEEEEVEHGRRATTTAAARLQAQAQTSRRPAARRSVESSDSGSVDEYDEEEYEEEAEGSGSDGGGSVVEHGGGSGDGDDSEDDAALESEYQQAVARAQKAAAGGGGGGAAAGAGASPSPAGRGPGGHKPRSSPPRDTASGRRALRYEDEEEDEDEDDEGDEEGGQSPLESSEAEESPVDSQDDEEDEAANNPLLVANSLLPLSLPQLEALHTLLHELGFALVDLETLALCTSTLLPKHSGARSAGGASSSSPPTVQPVSLSAWLSCVKSLRLHSHAPKLFTQVLLALFHALDLNKSGQCPYGELVSSLAVLCRASSHRARLQFIFQALQRSHEAEAHQNAAEANASAAPMSPREPERSALPLTCVYGFLFSASLTLHLLLRVSEVHQQRVSAPLSDAALAAVQQSVTVQNQAIWQLTNGLYALFDQQINEDGAPDVTYARFVQWKHHPSSILEALLQ